MSSWKRINKSDRKFIKLQKKLKHERFKKMYVECKSFIDEIRVGSRIMSEEIGELMYKNSFSQFQKPKSKKILTLR